MAGLRCIKAKVLVVGGPTSGKTALIGAHTDRCICGRYLQTLGTQICVKTQKVLAPDGGDGLEVVLQVWNIASQGLRPSLKESFFFGANGILYVCDASRSGALGELDDWVEDIFSETGRIPLVILLNTKGKDVDEVIDEDVVAQAARVYDAPYLFTSWDGVGPGPGDAPRADANVERAIRALATQVVAKQIGHGAGVGSDGL